MKFKNTKIASQLLLGFAVILFFVIGVGIVSYHQTNQLYNQTEMMYQHPLQTRRAIGALNNEIKSIRIGLRDLLLAQGNEEEQIAIKLIEVSALNVDQHFNSIKKVYLGPIEEIDTAHQDYISWKSDVDKNIKLALLGERETVIDNISYESPIVYLRQEMLASISAIDAYAENKGDELYAASVELKNTLHKQLILLMVTILVFTLIISYNLIRNIQKPLDEMNEAVSSFHQGNMDARSKYEKNNEFGVLSYSINVLADLIQNNMLLNKKAVSLAEIMLSVDDVKEFFQATLEALTYHTGSHMAAVYLLSDDKKTFEYYKSIGMDDNAKHSFESDNFEGEFGSVLLTHKLQYIENIPEDTRFVFQTVSGKFTPREIITIPILSGNQVIAIVSLATIRKFVPQSIEFINNIIVTMSTRMEGVLAYSKIKEFKEALELQNRELVAHKSELSAQTVELIQQNTELEMQKKQLDEASRLKTNFLSNMSHELRTPLNSVIALSGVLNRRLIDQIPEEEYSYLEIIERNGKNLLTLINDILDISRIESGREEMEITEFDAISLITEVVNMIQPQAVQKDIGLLHESEAKQQYITSDADKLRHILQNLIGNAVKFTEKGKVTISAQVNEKNIEIKVIDTGIGISIENQSHIFDEFRQADGSTSRRFGGTGLGLAIAKKYANLLGGNVRVNSVLEEGSEFTLSLPLFYTVENRIIGEVKTPEPKYVNIRPLQSPVSELTQKTILLVDDNESAVIQIKDLVEGMGNRVLVARNAVEAFTIIDQGIPDSMILDLMMPEIDGFKVLEILRNAEPTAHIPVLVLTAKHITKEELKFLKRNNVHQLIQKGDVDRIKLQNAVATMLVPETAQVKLHKEYMVREGKPVVLVVEDNADNMTTMRALLADHYMVLEAVDGNEGIKVAKEHVPNLVLMDIALPGINGIEAFQEIRKMPKLQHIPIIALTASAMECDQEAILSHGFDAFIAKPILAKQLFEVISEVLYGK
ncbi:MAG: response regulator [Mobilitalea sp.]